MAMQQSNDDGRLLEMKDQFYDQHKIIGNNTVIGSIGGENPEIVSRELEVMTLGDPSSMNHISVRQMRAKS